jgi:hypothetical protein
MSALIVEAILPYRSVGEPKPGRAEAMRLPRVRWTVRRLMGVVAMLGLALGIADALWVSAMFGEISTQGGLGREAGTPVSSDRRDGRGDQGPRSRVLA